MLHFSWSIHNPYANVKGSQIYSIWKKLSENKTIDLSVLRTNCILGFGFDITHRQDHAGFNINVTVLGYDVDVNFYDKRHWDKEANDWVKWGAVTKDNDEETPSIVE